MKVSPKIGLSMRLEIETNRFYLGRDYCEALQNFGAIPLHIGLIPDEKYISEALSTLDGILLPGSDTDVEPLIYGEEPQPSLKKVVPEKDATDLLILKIAESLKMPVLAICFGMQILNVSRGGSLIQDISDEVKNPLKHEQGFPLNRNSHSLKVKQESFLASLIKTENRENSVYVNSHHHQSVKEVGANLIPTSWAKDGVIESIEDCENGRFVLGVQWHPELSWKTDKLSGKIFQLFVEESFKYANKKKEILPA